MSNDSTPTSGVSSDFEHVQLEDSKEPASSTAPAAAQSSKPSTAQPPQPSSNSPANAAPPTPQKHTPLTTPVAAHEAVTLDLAVFGIDDLGLASTYRPEDPSAIDGLTKTAIKDLEDVGHKVAELARTAASDVTKVCGWHVVSGGEPS